MKLITELTEDVKYVTESTESGDKKLYIEGIFLQCETANRNNRYYTRKTMDREVARYMKEFVEKGRAFGELGHPNGPSINLDRVSHLITNLRLEGNDYIGKALITQTPMGNIARGLIESGAQLGVSSRGMGSLSPGKDGIMEVQDDFYLATAADIVADPSAPDAFVQGIMEGVEWVWDNGIIKAQAVEQMKNTIKKASSAELEEAKLATFEKFLKLL
jgi:Prohead core protein serine protease